MDRKRKLEKTACEADFFSVWSDEWIPVAAVKIVVVCCIVQQKESADSAALFAQGSRIMLSTL